VGRDWLRDMARIFAQWPDRLLTDQEVAALLGISRRSVHRWATQGLLRRVRIAGTSRFRLADVRSLIEQQTPQYDERPARPPGAVKTSAGQGRHGSP
jgi:excisionase family DNA binding protein